MIADPLAIASILAALVVLALELEKRHQVFRALGPAMLVILLGMVLSNLGILTDTSSTYSWLSSWGVNLSIVLILVGVDLRSVLRAGPSMLIAFVLGAVGTAAGSLSAAVLVGSQVGPETWKLAGQYTGTYVGGGMNFAALGRAFDTSSDLFTAAIAADVTVTALWLMACLTIPVLLGSSRNSTRVKQSESGDVHTLEDSLRRTRNAVGLEQVAILALLALSLVWVSGRLQLLVPVIPQVLWLTSLAVIAAQVPALQKFHSGPLLGNYLLLLFLAGNGAQSVIANIVSIGPGVFYFALLTVSVHGVVLFGIGRLFGFQPSMLAVASQANIGGAASALALASARGYSEQVLSGIAVGLLGYAVGNYLGFMVAALTQSFLG